MIENKKNLSELTLEELWRLFPIVLSPNNPIWKEWAKEEIISLHGILKAYCPVVHHIGSTAIPSIDAKPIVDILVETTSTDDWNDIESLMESSGYIQMARNNERMSFNKGYTVNGYDEKVFHIHFHIKGEQDELLFRDFLIAHPLTAKVYENLKHSLLMIHGDDRDGYTKAKSEFIKNVLSEAKGKLSSSPEKIRPG